MDYITPLLILLAYWLLDSHITKSVAGIHRRLDELEGKRSR
jgi:hypothetical protein